MNSRELLDEHPDNIKYYGFGIPSADAQDILQCSKDAVTLVFKQKYLKALILRCMTSHTRNH